MDFLIVAVILILKLFLPILFLIVYACFIFLLIILLLLTEENGLHSLGNSRDKSTIQIPIKGYQQPSETIGNDVNMTNKASDGELQHPEECSSDSENSIDTTSPVAQCSSEEGSPKLVVTASMRLKQFDIPVLPPVVTTASLNVPEPPPIVREVPLQPNTKDTSLPTLQELQHNDKRDQDSSCDDSESEDEEDGSSVISYDEDYCGDLKMEEELILQGPILRQSSEPEPDTKSDQEVKNELMPLVKESRTVTESGSSIAPSIVSTDSVDMKCMDEEVNNAGSTRSTRPTVSTEKANQKHMIEEVNNKKHKKPTSIVPPNSTCKQPFDAVDQISQETAGDSNSGQYKKIFPDCTTPND